MSNEALRWVRDLVVPAPAKAVLWALADAAGDDGCAWPSMRTLARWTCLSERTLQDAVRALVAAGALQVTLGGGRLGTSRYRLLVGADVAAPARGKRRTPPQRARGVVETPRSGRGGVGGGASQTAMLLPFSGTPPQGARGGAPPQGARGGGVSPPAAGAGTPPQRAHPEPSVEPPSDSRRVERVVGVGAALRATRLPADWQPTADLVAYAAERGLDVRAVTENFRDYWMARAGEKGRKADWPATWRMWVRRDAERVHGTMGGVQRRAAGAVNRPSIFAPIVPEHGGRGPIIDGEAEGWS